MKFSYSWWQTSFVIFVAGVSFVVLPELAGKGLLSLPNTPTVREIIDFIAIFISWPAAAVFIAYYFLNKFHSALDTYLRSIGLLKLPGGVEIQTLQKENIESNQPDENQNFVLTPEDQASIKAFISSLVETANLSEGAKSSLEEQFDEMSHIAIQWKFRFLDQFFVFNTRRVLHWFSRVQPQPRDGYLTIWETSIPDVDQRQLILNLLLHFGLLIEKNGLFQITDHGYSFLQFIEQ